MLKDFLIRIFKNQINHALMLTIVIYAGTTNWLDWRDYLLHKKLTHQLHNLSKYQISEENEPLQRLEYEYRHYPRLLCRLAELYTVIGHPQRGYQLLIPLADKMLHDCEQEDVLITLLELSEDPFEQLDFLEVLLKKHSTEPSLLLKKFLLLQATEQIGNMPEHELTFLKEIVSARHGLETWNYLIQNKND